MQELNQVYNQLTLNNTLESLFVISGYLTVVTYAGRALNDMFESVDNHLEKNNPGLNKQWWFKVLKISIIFMAITLTSFVIRSALLRLSSTWISDDDNVNFGGAIGLMWGFVMYSTQAHLKKLIGSI
jgi:hypothetical protein